MQHPTRLIVVLGVSLAVLALVTTVLVLLVERRGPPSYPPGSPEATVVAYIEALRAADRERVLALLSERARSEIQRREEREPFYDFDVELRATADSLRAARVRITRVDAADYRATVTILVERSGTGLEPGFPLPGFDAGAVSYERTLHLVREDGAWKIDELALYL